MKQIAIFFNIIYYVICDATFFIDLVVKRVFPLYGIYKIAARYKITKIERPLYKYFWWLDTNGNEKKCKREQAIYYAHRHGIIKMLYLLYYCPIIISIQSIYEKFFNTPPIISLTIIGLIFIIISAKIFDKKKIERYFKIFNRIRSRHINKWRIMAIVTLISGIILLNYINRIMLFILSF